MSFKTTFFNLFLVFFTLLGYAQCPLPSGNFENFATGSAGITPATENVPVSANSVWGGDYVVVNVEDGVSYNITTVGSEERVAAAFPTLGRPQVDFDPVMTVYDNSGTVSSANSTGATMIGYNEDFSATEKMPELEYTATYTGKIYVFINATPGTVVYSSLDGISISDNSATCATFATDSTSVQVTRLAATTLSTSTYNFDKVSVYPNPVTEVLNIELNKNSILEIVKIYDISGKEIFADTVSQIDMSSYNSGVYLVEVKSNFGISTHKIIKE